MARLGIKPNQIIQLELCGQEPTITLQYITKMLPEIFNYFPNLNSINLSTNETDNPEEIVDFISVVNQYHTNSFELFIQWSYDEMDKYKNIIVGNIIRNIKSVIKRLHNIDFNNMTVKMRA